MLWKKLISATFFIEVFGISKVVSKVNWKPTGPEGSCVQPENMYLWILKGGPNERAPNEECWCVEMSGTQMAHGRSVSSYGELKDAFREEGGRKTVQEGGPEREQSGWGATETLIQNIKGALKLTQRPSPDGDRELAAKTREGKKAKVGSSSSAYCVNWLENESAAKTRTEEALTQSSSHPLDVGNLWPKLKSKELIMQTVDHFHTSIWWRWWQTGYFSVLHL